MNTCSGGFSSVVSSLGPYATRIVRFVVPALATENDWSEDPDPNAIPPERDGTITFTTPGQSATDLPSNAYAHPPESAGVPRNASIFVGSGAAADGPPKEYGLDTASAESGPSRKYVPDWTVSPAGIDTPVIVMKPSAAACHDTLGHAGTP